jgi:hypothetical protein
MYVTDEDDCSAPPDTDLFNKDAPYGMEASYRCTNYGIVCGNPPQLAPYGDSGGPLMGCRGAPNTNGNVSGPPPAGEGKLFDVNRYIDFFQSLKPDPRDVLLAAITAPSEPFVTVVGDPGRNDPTRAGGYADCAAGAMIGTQTCAVLLGHSCDATAGFVGDPAVRINQVVTAVNGQVSSLCQQDYTPSLVAVGQAIAARLQGP